jgi:hypothetical protein
MRPTLSEFWAVYKVKFTLGAACLLLGVATAYFNVWSVWWVVGFVFLGTAWCMDAVWAYMFHTVVKQFNVVLRTLGKQKRS